MRTISTGFNPKLIQEFQKEIAFELHQRAIILHLRRENFGFSVKALALKLYKFIE